MTITELDPPSANEGDADFILTVKGTGFTSGMKVRFNEEERVTSFISSTELHADILAADVAIVKPVFITVIQPPSGPLSNSEVFYIVPLVTPSCFFTVSMSLEWGDNSDIDLYVKDENLGGICYWNNKSTTNLILGYDANPNCKPINGPAPEETIGTFDSIPLQKLRIWYNQYSDCTGKVIPTQKLFVRNGGDLLLKINYPGYEDVILDTGEAYQYVGGDIFGFAGYGTGTQTIFPGGTIVTFTCPP